MRKESWLPYPGLPWINKPPSLMVEQHKALVEANELTDTNLSSLPYQDSNCQSLGQQAVTLHFTSKLETHFKWQSSQRNFLNFIFDSPAISLFWFNLILSKSYTHTGSINKNETGVFLNSSGHEEASYSQNTWTEELSVLYYNILYMGFMTRNTCSNVTFKS